MSDVGKNMIVAGLDQDYAALVDHFATLAPGDRHELANWLTGKHGDITRAPHWVLTAMQSLASTAFMEVALRWRAAEEESGE